MTARLQPDLRMYSTASSGQSPANASALVIRIDRDHVDLAGAGLWVHKYGDKAGRTSIRLRDPDTGLTRQADRADRLNLRAGPVQVQPEEDISAEHLLKRREDRSPCPYRERDHVLDVGRQQRANRQSHDSSMG